MCRLNKLNIVLYKWFTFLGYNYCNPGTDLHCNLGNNIQPVNRVHKACIDHDIRYSLKQITRREADEILLDDIKKIENPTLREFYAIIIIKIVFYFKLKFGCY